MKKIKEFLQKNKLFLIIMIISIIIMSIPYWIDGIFIGDDYIYHLARIDSLSKSLLKGDFPVKIHYFLANSFGYGNGFFYSNLFLYIPAILEIIGVNLINSYKIFIILLYIILFLLAYFSLNEIMEDKKSALIGTIIVFLSKSVITNVYYRFALGEFLGYIFILPALAGMYNYVHKDFSKPAYLIIGFCGALYSHLITTLLITAFGILYFVINIKTTVKNPKKLLKLIIVGIIILLITASFWMPMLEQFFSQEFRLSKPWYSISDDEFDVLDLIGTERNSMGYILTISLPILLYSIISKKIEKKYKIFGICVLIIMILLCWKSFWGLRYIHGIVNKIQFKFRLVGPITILFSISIASVCKSLKEKINLNYVVIGVMICSCICIGIYLKSLLSEKAIRVSNINNVSNDLYLNATSLGGGQEYLPVNCDYTYFSSPNTARYSSLEEIEVKKDGLSCEFEKEINGKDFIDVPLVYYKGYQAEMITESNEKIKLDVSEAEIGLVRINLPEEKGTVKVYYKKTTIQKISYILSLLTLILIVLYYLIGKDKCLINKKERRV